MHYVQAPVAEPFGLAQVRALVEDIKAGRVDTLVITSWNPLYALPSDAGLAELLNPATNPDRAKLSVLYTGLYEDETSQYVDWFVPAAHPLETWSDGRAVDGTVSIAQPLIQPLFNGMPESELLALDRDLLHASGGLVLLHGGAQALVVDLEHELALRHPKAVLVSAMIRVLHPGSVRSEPSSTYGIT